jgi:hypothetical protein
MTTHELAKLIDSLRLAFGDNLKKSTSDSMTEAAVAFRELPDQNLRAFLTSVRRAPDPQPATGRGGRAAAPATADLIEQIRAVRAGTAPAGTIVDLAPLKKDALKEIAKAFGQPVSGTNPELVSRIRALCVRTDEPNPVPEPQPPAFDQAAVDVALVLHKQISADRKLSLQEVRAQFEPFRHLPKPVVEEVCRQIGFSAIGSREDLLDRLLKGLENLKMNQHRADSIQYGTSG